MDKTNNFIEKNAFLVVIMNDTKDENAKKVRASNKQNWIYMRITYYHLFSRDLIFAIFAI